MTRSAEIYVSPLVKRGLALAALKLSGEDGKISSDEIADKVLDAWLLQNHPEISAHVGEQEQREQDFRKSLTANRASGD